jgi:uncharacterized protein (TIGR02594 family)
MRAVAVAVLVSLALASAAQAGHRHIQQQTVAVVADNWFWPRAVAVRDAAWEAPGRATQSGERILAEASKFIGQHNPTGTVGPWCRDFVNMILRRTGHYVDSSRLAIGSLRLGHRVSTPARGDLVVMRGHVTFYAGMKGHTVIGLGGNQGHRVKYSNYPLSRVIAFVRPT